MKRWKLTLALAGLSTVSFVGCAEVDYQDVQAARENLHEEVRETAEIREEFAAAVAEEEAETVEALRHHALKPAPEVMDEYEETKQLREEAAKAIAAEEEETREARIELDETRRRLAAQEARDSFVKAAQAKLEMADERIEQLETLAAEQQDPAKVETEVQIRELKTRRARLQEELGELQSARLTAWETHRDQVQRAQDDLQAEMDESK